MPEKTLAYWLAFAAALLWVAMREAETESLKRRLVKTLASGGLAIGLSDDIAEWSGVPPVVVAVGIVLFGLLVVDLTAALIADRSFLREVIASKMGVKK